MKMDNTVKEDLEISRYALSDILNEITMMNIDDDSISAQYITLIEHLEKAEETLQTIIQLTK